MQLWRRQLTIALKFPCEHGGVVFVVPERLAVGCLMLFAEMCSSRFIALEGVGAHQLSKLQKICHPSSAFERLIKILAVTEHADITPKFLAQLRNRGQRLP